MIEVSKRLKTLRLNKGLTQADLAYKARTTQQSIQRIESGQSAGRRVIDKIAEALNVHPSWLVFGTDENQADSYKLPILEWKDLIRKNGWPTPNENTKYISMPSVLCGKNSYALIVKGDSMESQIPGKKSFLPGEIIAVDPERKPVCGSYVIALINENSEPVFKQYVEDGPNTYLKPLNPQYPTVEMTMNMKVIGVVCAHLDLSLASNQPSPGF